MVIPRDLNYIEMVCLDRVIIETNSLLVKNIIDRNWKVPWKVVTILEEIWRLSQGKSVIITHIFREENKMADHLANLA